MEPMQGKLASSQFDFGYTEQFCIPGVTNGVAPAGKVFGHKPADEHGAAGDQKGAVCHNRNLLALPCKGRALSKTVGISLGFIIPPLLPPGKRPQVRIMRKKYLCRTGARCTQAAGKGAQPVGTDSPVGDFALTGPKSDRVRCRLPVKL